MAASRQQEHWPWYGDLQPDQALNYGGWRPEDLDAHRDIYQLKKYVHTNKKIVVVGGKQAPALSQRSLAQIIGGDEKAWDGMAPRNIQMFHVLQHFMGGVNAARLAQFGHIDHAETVRELIKGCGAAAISRVEQPSPKELAQRAKDVTSSSNKAFRNADILGKSTVIHVACGSITPDPLKGY